MGLVGNRTARPAQAEDNGATRGSRYRRGGASDEDEAPRGRRGGRDGSTAESNGGRNTRFRRSSQGEDDSRGGRRRGRDGDVEPAGPSREQQRGWSGFNRMREETSQFADRFKLSEENWQLIAFLEDEPFEAAARHYLNALNGQKMFICPGKKGPYRCPLCAMGDQAMPIGYFNIVVFDDEGNPETKVWECGPGYAGDIEVMSESRAVNGKLSSVYFEVHGKKAGKSKRIDLEMNVVRERDLEEEWHIQPLTDEEWDDLYKEVRKPGYVKLQPESVLQGAADELRRHGD